MGKKKSNWGGKRTPGKNKRLGRPRIYKDAQKIRSILITEELYNYAKEVGGNASEGVRLALEFHRAMRHQFNETAPPERNST